MRRFASSLLILSFLVFTVVPTAVKAAYKGYDAQLQSFRGPSSPVNPGERVEIEVNFKNTGTQTWLRTGKTFLSAYHWDPVKKVETKSVFFDTSWESPTRPLRLPVASVAPNKTVAFRFFATAPKTPGHYHEDFILTAENTAWIKTGGFYLDLTVKEPTTNVSPPTASATPQIKREADEIPIQAEIVDRGGSEWAVAAQDDLAIRVGIKNNDTRLWSSDQVYLAPVDENNQPRTSVFTHPTWSGAKAGTVENGPVHGLETARLKLLLRAPNTPGLYRERFQLMTAAGKPVPNISFLFVIRVAPAPTFEGTAVSPDDSAAISPSSPTPTPAPSIPIATNDGAYVTSLLLRSDNNLSLLGNGRQQLTYGFKNTGTQAWNQLQARLVSVTPEPSKRRWVQDDSWMSVDQTSPVNLKTLPGEIGYFSFYLKAPPKRGTYVFKFRLFANGQAVQNGDLTIPLTVATDGYIEAEPLPPVVVRPTTPSSPSTPVPNLPSIEAQPLNGDVNALSPEPIIRVGLFKTTDDQMMIRAKYAPLTVFQGSTSVCHVNIGTVITVRYDRGLNSYQLSGGECSGQSSTPYLVRADDNLSAMEIADFSRPVSWLPGANDNTFRIQLELRFTPATSETWIINELPIEWYLKGIAETSNVSPPEFQRTLLTAARTYAMYHVLRGTKHAATFFTVDATYDQVYRGYGAEQRDPAVVAAIDATRGQIVTYNGSLALTPYYSRSDGRTRSWGEVWYGGSQYPWLVSVPVPWDQGRTLLGHGVGLSASGALGMANDGKRYDEILKYFYTGTDLRRAYR